MKEENTETDAREKLPTYKGGVEVRVDGEKPLKRKWVGVNIKFSDNHYLASFNHNEPPRVFHNIIELLAAIEVECEKLK